MSTLPDPPTHRRRTQRPIVTVAVFGGGVCLLAAIVAIAVLGWHWEGTNEVAITGLATIGATLAGAFASWMAGNTRRDDDDA